MTLLEQLKARLNATDKFGAMEGTIDTIIDEFAELWQCRKYKHNKWCDNAYLGEPAFFCAGFEA